MNGSALPRCTPSSRAGGFTLVELMFTVAIAAILVSLAAPSFNDFVIRNRTSSITNEFVGSVLRARTEAVSRNTCSTMCRSATTANAIPSCAGAGTDWGAGWIVFRNAACDASVVTPTAADLVLVVESVNLEYTVSGPAGLIFFSPTGTPRPSDAGSFLVRYQSSTRPSNRTICLSSLGRTLNTNYGDPCP